jgi:hypothetical protein
MREVVSVRNWVFWWAILTTTVFLQEWLRRLADFLRDKTIFSPNGFPFNVIAGLNGLVDNAATAIRGIGFDPSQQLAKIGPVTIQNWVIALFVGLVALALAALFYIRALQSPTWGDDILALVVLYFVIRIEAQLISIAKVSPLTPAGRELINNPAATFWILMLFLLVDVFLGEGLHSKRAFWRGLLEAVFTALLLLPAQSAQILAFGIDRFADFGRVVQTNLVFGLIWGIVGMLLALTRLYGSSGEGRKAAER